MTNPGEATLLIGSANALHKRKLKDHLGDTLNVKAFGAVGDGMTDDTSAIQACLDTLQPRYGLGNYTIHFPAGDYVTTDMLTFGAYSVNIVGSGKRATRIRNTVSGKVVLRADGVQYSSLQDLCLVSAGGVGSICFDWSDITSTITGANFFAVMNCTFDGGETGVRMGAGAIPGHDDQASETTWINCDFINCAKNGIVASNGNCLNHVISGGIIGNCGEVGINGGSGSFPLIQGVTFFNNSYLDPFSRSLADIVHTNRNSITVIGCSSTSTSFFIFGGTNANVIGCRHAGAAGGFFLRSDGRIVCDSCHSVNGAIEAFGGGSGSKVYFRGCLFENPAYLTSQPYGGTVEEPNQG